MHPRPPYNPEAAVRSIADIESDLAAATKIGDEQRCSGLIREHEAAIKNASSHADWDGGAFQRAVHHRDRLIVNEAWLSSDEIAIGTSGAELNACANQDSHQLRQTGQVLGVRHGRQRLHPACQFHTVGGQLVPLPMLRHLLELLPKDESGWTQAFWIFQPTGRLQGTRPADVLATRHEDVLLAAKKDFHGDESI